MEDEFNRSEFGSSGPSDDDLDRAIEAARIAAEKERSGTTEPEDEDEAGDDDNATNDDAPGGQNDDDDLEADEANTPDEDDEAVVVKPQESRKKTVVEEQEGSDDDNENGQSLSRKQRGKIIEEYRQELEKSEKQRKELEAQVKAAEEEDSVLTQEVNRALGTDAEYDKAVEDGLNGDEEAQEKAKVWKANRAFYKKLVSKAGKQYQAEFAQEYWNTVKDLPGINMEIVGNKDLATIMKHVHEAGATSTAEKYKEQVEQLQRKITTMQGKAKSAGPQEASKTKRSPITGGGEPVAQQPFNWQRTYLDKEGLPTDEFESLVRQHGFEAVTSGKFYKKR